MDGYEVLEKLGSGSFGTIRRIIRKSDNKVFRHLIFTKHLHLYQHFSVVVLRLGRRVMHFGLLSCLLVFFCCCIPSELRS